MKRRKFLSDSLLAGAGLSLPGFFSLIPGTVPEVIEKSTSGALYDIFRNPPLGYHPYVRWWWNGNKVEATELVRELRLLRDAGIGGVEINPVEFPTRSEGDDLGKQSLKWLSAEWIDMLKVAFREAKALGMTCDLIVGSGWPFGAEYLKPEERAQVAVIAVKKLTGPLDYEISEFEIFREADPAISSPFPGRTMQLLSLKLVPDPVAGIEQVTELPAEEGRETIKIQVPPGKHALYALVRINGFMQVINGAPGATGPVLNHYDAATVRAYLDRMSDTIEKQAGPLSENVRSLFTDSMELEGSNWSHDMREEFINRRGYDIFPYLPFVLFKTGAMGNVTDTKYGVDYTPGFSDMIASMRYDFELTKAELLEERFIRTYTGWCRDLKVKSRAQAYGRGFFPLESSLHYDIPECESWTTNWLKHKVGEEMPEEDYRRGRAYTMINKYVSSAANLSGKRLVSCEEMTDTYTVFNTSLENLKIGGDQGAISGVTHSVFHGFNYSPPEAPYPGWIRYGAYYNENNTWWPYFRLYNEYKGRMSALLQNLTMYADIAILPPLDDMWRLIGQQMEPFPSVTHADWFTLVWEAINKNGCGCDYISARILRDSSADKGCLCYGPRRYRNVFLVNIESIAPEAAGKLLSFVSSGGRVFCIETIPFRSPGWKDHENSDREVTRIVNSMKEYRDRFILLQKPEKDFIGWFAALLEKYGITPCLRIGKPDPFVMQNMYIADDGSRVVYIINSHIRNSYSSTISFSKDITAGRYGWIWNAESGERHRIEIGSDGSFDLDLGPADSRIFVFDGNRKGQLWNPIPGKGNDTVTIDRGWQAEFIHCRKGSIAKTLIDDLKDLKDVPEFQNFAGTVVYRRDIEIVEPAGIILNPGKVYGLAEVTVNGVPCGVRWYGRRLFRIGDKLKKGTNRLEIKVVTSMGNYMKSLTDNPVAQYWTNEKNKVQAIQSLGLIGPVTLYKKAT